MKNIIREFKKEIASLIAVGKINNQTAEKYINLAEKILNIKSYLKRQFSNGHLRRIKRVFKILDRIVAIGRKYGSDVTYKAISGIFSAKLNMLFDSVAEYIIGFRNWQKEQRLKRQLSLFCKMGV